MFDKKELLVRDTYDRLIKKATVHFQRGEYYEADFFERLASKTLKRYRGEK